MYAGLNRSTNLEICCPLQGRKYRLPGYDQPHRVVLCLALASNTETCVVKSGGRQPLRPINPPHRVQRGLLNDEAALPFLPGRLGRMAATGGCRGKGENEELCGLTCKSSAGGASEGQRRWVFLVPLLLKIGRRSTLLKIGSTCVLVLCRAKSSAARAKRAFLLCVCFPSCLLLSLGLGGSSQVEAESCVNVSDPVHPSRALPPPFTPPHALLC